MTLRELENLVQLGRLKRELPTEAEIDSLTRSGEARLADVGTPGLSLESRFDLAFNAAHALSLIALRRLGYRPESPNFAFQTLPYTIRLAPERCQVLAKCQQIREKAGYAGDREVDESLVTELIDVATAVWDSLREDESTQTK